MGREGEGVRRGREGRGGEQGRREGEGRPPNIRDALTPLLVNRAELDSAMENLFRKMQSPDLFLHILLPPD